MIGRSNILTGVRGSVWQGGAATSPTGVADIAGPGALGTSPLWPQPRGTAGPRHGFSLVELLVVISIIALLLSILGSAVVEVRDVTRGVMCQSKLQTVSQKFRLFANDYGHPYRGDSEVLGPNRFRIEEFQQSLYRIDEFWEGPRELGAPVRYDPIRQPLMCPAGAVTLSRMEPTDTRPGWITPLDNVSVGFNMRLFRASVRIADRWVLRDVTLNAGITDHPWVPLAFDVDGHQAKSRLLEPFYSAPAVGDPGKYADDQLWFPARRHAGKVHAGFVGGHVLLSDDPVAEPGWDWRYQPPPND